VPRRFATTEFTIGNPAAAVWPRSASGLAERDPGGAQADADRGGAGAARYGSWKVHTSSPHVTLAELQLRKSTRFVKSANPSQKSGKLGYDAFPPHFRLANRKALWLRR
jgi:hypothetical protein